MFDMQTENNVTHIVEQALLEDIGMGDVTTESTISADVAGTGNVLVKEPGIIAGIDVAELVFRMIDEDLEFKANHVDGASVYEGSVVASLNGSIASMLKGERTALNLMQRMSGIATM